MKIMVISFNLLDLSLTLWLCQQFAVENGHLWSIMDLPIKNRNVPIYVKLPEGTLICSMVGLMFGILFLLWKRFTHTSPNHEPDAMDSPSIDIYKSHKSSQQNQLWNLQKIPPKPLWNPYHFLWHLKNSPWNPIFSSQHSFNPHAFCGAEQVDTPLHLLPRKPAETEPSVVLGGGEAIYNFYG